MTGPALGIAARIRAGATTAATVTEAVLAGIAGPGTAINSFTAVTAERARAEAAAVDAALARGEDPGPLAGVPYAVKNLFDVAGLPTLAGAALRRDGPVATRDAHLVRRMAAAGAVLVGALNMDEFAYGFTTENTAFGATRNPHDPTRIAGGSSGGSAAAVAAGLVPLALGTDTNGSIRVPASLCGVFGVKPTYGRLGRGGATLFVPSLDHVGPFARSVADLAAVYDALGGADPHDPVQAPRVPEPVADGLRRGITGLRVARLGGWFAARQSAAARDAVERVATALRAAAEVTLPGAEAARAAAFLITSAEGASQHLPELRARPEAFEPLTVDRLLAGALIPAAWVLHAQRLRGAFATEARGLFRDWDVLLAPATPVAATPIGQELIELDGETLPLRPSLGLFTQPISLIGLPVLTVPAVGAPGALPIGVQLIGAPWAEAALFRAAAALEAMGVCAAPIAPAFAAAAAG